MMKSNQKLPVRGLLLTNIAESKPCNQSNWKPNNGCHMLHKEFNIPFIESMEYKISRTNHCAIQWSWRELY